jgi:hypothetical protein
VRDARGVAAAFWLLALGASIPRPSFAQAVPALPTREVIAVRAAAAPVIDGRLDDPVWAGAPPVSGFLQRDPNEGQPASEDTRVRVAYDDDAIYVAGHLLDRDPAAIVRQLSRRDASVEADGFVLYLDAHNDRLTGAQFAVSAAGVQRDALIYNDSFLDSTWDAVWESAVAVGADGWTVEMRIPLSQLRFPKAARYTWGINVQRIIRRRNETDWLQLVRKNESGLASRMARLEGIEGIHPPSTLQLLPYVTARGEYIRPSTSGSPFNDGSRYFGSGGLDLKYGISSSLALTAAFNPDFGQVEVDPAVVNLTQFETFFEERRPFFTEGAKVFGNFGKSGASETWGFYRPEPTLFYSRRIGRAPQLTASGTYVDTPAATTILGAAKLVGRTRSGWTIGAMEAVTSRERANVSDGLNTTRPEVEPITNYAVFRAQRELGRRGALGFLGTSVARDLTNPVLAAMLTDRATMLGVDGHAFLDGARRWVFHGGIAGSWVHGTTDAITRLQKAEQRYDQRPDAPHVKLDPTARSMSGWTGQANLNRNSGNVTVNLGIWGMSPGLEVNDAGYSTQTDRAGAHALVQWRKLTPDRWTRERTWWVSKWWTWNYGNESQGDGWQTSVIVQLRNFWRSAALFSYAKRVWDDKLTRGGPTVIRPGNHGVTLSLVTDTRRRLALSSAYAYTGREFHSEAHAAEVQLVWRPLPALTVTAGPSVAHNIVAAQYVAAVSDALATRTFGRRYVFGELNQTQVQMTARVNLVTSPRTSLQIYLQPLVSAAAYGAIKEVYAPRTYDFVRYGLDAGTVTQSGSQLTIDPDGAGPASPFSITKPDFNLRSLKANAIFRWEFRPGSSLFVVWTQQRRDRVVDGTFDLGSDASRVFTARPDNVFLVKISYWLGAHR